MDTMNRSRRQLTFSINQRRANQGDAEAQFYLYKIYADGDEELDIPFDFSEALKWLRKSAAQGYAPAVGSLGEELITGGMGEIAGENLSDPAKGLQMVKQAAEQGHIRSLELMGGYSFKGKLKLEEPGTYLDADAGEAVNYWEKAASLGSQDARKELAKLMIMGVGMEQDFSRAESQLKSVVDATAGNEELEFTRCEALFWLGYMRYYGLGCQVDTSAAMDYFNQAKERFMPADDVVSSGDDPREALTFWNYPYDAATWFDMYHPEEDADEEEAPGNPFNEAEDKYDVFDEDETLLGKKAMAGDMEAMHELGRMIVEQGDYLWSLLEVEPNETAENDRLYNEGWALYRQDRFVDAIESFLMPAFNGYVDAMFYIGDCYFRYWQEGGETPDGDPEWDDEYCLEQAFRYYLMAACNGNGYAQCELGKDYYYGRVPDENGSFELFTEDYEAAAYWFDRASVEYPGRKGNADAANFLGTMYEDGYIGGRKDSVKAAQWFSKAALLSK